MMDTPGRTHIHGSWLVVRGGLAAVCRPRRRRGVFLVIVIAVVGLMGGLITLLARNAATSYEAHQATRLRCISRAVTDSAVAYARARHQNWATTMPAEPETLDVRPLVPAKYEATVTINFVRRDDRPVCLVSTRVERAGVGISDEVEIDLREPSLQ